MSQIGGVPQCSLNDLHRVAPGSSRAIQPSSRRWSCTWARKSTGANRCSMPRSEPWPPCPARGSPAARQQSRPTARPGQPEQIREPATVDALTQRKGPRHGRIAGSRAEPGDVADAPGDPDGHDPELISTTRPGLVRSSRSSNSLKNPALKATADAVPARHAVSPRLCPRCAPGPDGVLSVSCSSLRAPRTVSLPWGSDRRPGQGLRRKARSEALLQLGWDRFRAVLADPHVRSGGTQAVGRAPLQSRGMPYCDSFPPGFGR